MQWDASYRIGEVDRLQERERELAPRMSHQALRRAWPGKYAMPLPTPSEIEQLRQQVKVEKDRRHRAFVLLTKLQEENSRLVNAMRDAQFSAVSIGLRAITISEVKRAFINALHAEGFLVRGEPYAEAHLISPNRSADHAKPRQVCMWLCRKLTKQSTTAIGKAHGGRDHTTCMHAEEMVKSGKAFSVPELRNAADRVLAQFKAAQ